MLKKFLIVCVCTASILLCLFGCGGESTPSNESDFSETDTIQPEETADVNETGEIAQPETLDYQGILDKYSQKIRDAVPSLIEEYQKEASLNTGGLQGLAEICNEKVGELAEISNDGISEMAEYYYSFGSGSYEEYEEWAGKLMDVYMEEASKIQDAYMDSAK